MPVLKQEYNQALARYHKAFTYLDSNAPDREKWLPEYQKLLDRLNELVTLMREQGIPHTMEELQEGFAARGFCDTWEGKHVTYTLEYKTKVMGEPMVVCREIAALSDEDAAGIARHILDKNPGASEPVLQRCAEMVEIGGGY